MMISDIAYFLWMSKPFMTAIFTILFLILIRVWTRSNQNNKVKKCTKKIGSVVNQSFGEMVQKSLNESHKKDTHGKDTHKKDTHKKDNDGCDGQNMDQTADQNMDQYDESSIGQNSLDTLFYGELFVAAGISGGIISLGW